MRTPITLAINPNTRANVAIYRPFFLSGMLAALTAGCLLGAVALFGIAMRGNYAASVWTPYVLAHANSQLYGWVGFFIVGFALQQHPPSIGRSELFHRLAAWILVLLAVGIGLRFAAEPLVAVDRTVWLPVGVLSSVLQALGVALFIATIGITRHKSGEGLTWQTVFVFASLGWWMLVALAEPFYFALSHQVDPTASIAFVARWFPPYREAQFLGFVPMMIFGVALVKMNSCFGAAKPSRIMGLIGFALWNGGLLCRMVGWLRYMDSDMAPGAGNIYFLGGALIALGAMVLVANTRMFEALETRLPSHKFIRAAMIWLIVSGFLMVMEPLHLRLIGQPFSHAFIGAIRHALTVGFISQMIVGVSMHVVTRMNDITENAAPSLWIVFVLLNLGNALRVVLEVASDYTPHAFAPMSITGFIELTAIAIWAWCVARPMLRSRRLSHA